MPLYYDENNNEIKPYTEEEYRDFLEEVKLEEEKKSQVAINELERGIIKPYIIPKYYSDFGPATFSNYVWIKNGMLYRNPLYVSVERINRTDGLSVYYYDGSGAYKGKTVFPTYGNLWFSANVGYLTRGTSYKFRLVSESGETAKTKQGQVGYDG